jgi:hypothetical protein
MANATNSGTVNSTSAWVAPKAVSSMASELVKVITCFERQLFGAFNQNIFDKNHFSNN